MAGNLLVFIERRDGEIKRPSLETLAAARRMADANGAGVDALALGPAAGEAVGVLARHGADRVFVVEAEHMELYSAEAYAASLGDLARQEQSALVLAAATVMGKELAARTAARIGCACASDLVEVDLDGGALVGRRPVYSGKAYVRVRAAGGRTVVATLRPNVFPAARPKEGAQAERIDLAPVIAADRLGVRTLRVEKPEQKEQDVAEAAIVVSGGRGLREPENFRLVRELAEALGGAVGASRAVVDAGWIEHRYQVGQTGKVVSPNLYVACGISGAIQHLAGMSSSKIIVAINKDPDAPIFKVADFGIVGDLFEVLPAMTEAARSIER